jgi:hypothetical protein
MSASCVCKALALLVYTSMTPADARYLVGTGMQELYLTLACSAAAPSPVQLATEKHLNLKQLKFFVIDECDKVLEKHGELTAALRALLFGRHACLRGPCEYACTCLALFPPPFTAVLVRTTASEQVALGCVCTFQWLPPFYELALPHNQVALPCAGATL